MNFLDIKNIEEESVAMFFLDLLFLIAPGTLLIYYFHLEFFLTLDVLKLIILSISIVTPFIVINTFIYLMKAKGTKGETFNCITIGLFLTNIIFYIALFITYLFKFSFQNTIFEIIILELIFVIFIYKIFKK